MIRRQGRFDYSIVPFLLVSLISLTATCRVRADPPPELIPHWSGLVDFDVDAMDGSVFAGGDPLLWLEFASGDPGVGSMDGSAVYIALIIDSTEIFRAGATDTRWNFEEGNKDFLFSTDIGNPSHFPFEFEYTLTSGHHDVRLVVEYGASYGWLGGDGSEVFFDQTISVNVP